MSRYVMGCRFHGRSAVVEVGKADYYDRLEEVTVDPVSGRISHVESEGRCEYGEEWTEPQKIVCRATIPAFSEVDPYARDTCDEVLARYDDGEGWVRTRIGIAIKVSDSSAPPVRGVQIRSTPPGPSASARLESVGGLVVHRQGPDGKPACGQQVRSWKGRTMAAYGVDAEPTCRKCLRTGGAA